MRKMIAIITSLCLLTGYPTECIMETIGVFADPAYSLYAKKTAIEVVTAQLEALYESLIYEESSY